MIFEALAYEDNEGRDALRKATVLASTRLRTRFSKFIETAVSDKDREARLALVKDDIKATVVAACEEYGVDPAKVEGTVISHFLAGAEHLKEYQFKKKDAEPEEEEDSADSFDNELEGKESALNDPAQFQNPAPPPYNHEEQGVDPRSCPSCYDESVGGQPCPYHMQQGMAAHGPPQAQLFARTAWNDSGYDDGGGGFPSGGMETDGFLGPGMQGDPSLDIPCPNCGAREGAYDHGGPWPCAKCGYSESRGVPPRANENDYYLRGPGEDHLGRIARRPKMCPYHRELVDSSLHAGEPQYGAFAGAVGGAGHCAGAYDGTCNFKPAMVSQKYWDDRQNTLDQARQQTELDNQTFVDAPIPEAIPEETQSMNDGEGVTDINHELDNAPSAVAAEPMPMAASTRLADGANQNSQVGDWTERESLPDHKNDSSTGLSDQPSPKMDKTKWKPNVLNDKGNLKPIETDKGTKWPTDKQDITDKPDWEGDFLRDTDSVAEHNVDVTQGSEHSPKPAPVDSPYQWTDKSTQADPVTASVDPEKNPIRELLSGGFIPQDQVDQIVSDYNSE